MDDGTTCNLYPCTGLHNLSLFLAECICSHDEIQLVTPSGQEPTSADPLIMCKALRDPSFCLGQLIIRPGQEKGMQVVRKDKMVGQLC
jgi:hypothetical protein